VRVYIQESESPKEALVRVIVQQRAKAAAATSTALRARRGYGPQLPELTKIVAAIETAEDVFSGALLLRHWPIYATENGHRQTTSCVVRPRCDTRGTREPTDVQADGAYTARAFRSWNASSVLSYISRSYKHAHLWQLPGCLVYLVGVGSNDDHYHRGQQ